MVVTRFNPSANGPLHLGHIYMAQVNREFARQRGGTFKVRFDDSHPLYVKRLGRKHMLNIVEGQTIDLQWLGLTPESYTMQSGILPGALEGRAAHLPRFQDREPARTPRLIASGIPIYPYTPLLTLEKVILDFDSGITHVIRGVDLLSEYSLYQYYCECMGYEAPVHIYLPRLRWEHGDMSKTYGALSVCELRNRGYEPEEVMSMVAAACLVNPADGWIMDNIKEQPSL